ncbi:MAG: hypothetical protein JST93_13285 [Acidobacteria bacterium]|nr:hypothetical protein [Acidobacteriota bacterium]
MPATSAKQAKEKKQPLDPADDFSLIRLSPRAPFRSRFTVKEIDRAVKKVIAARKAREAKQSGNPQ